MSDLSTLGEEAERVAAAFAPALLAGRDHTLMVIVCDGDGWSCALRGSRPHAIVALEAVLEDVRNGEGYAPYDPPVA